MNRKITQMIGITGAAGFIGSYLLGCLNKIGISDVCIVDAFQVANKIDNWKTKSFSLQIERSNFINQFPSLAKNISFVIHLGARTDTTEFNTALLDELNTNYSKEIWNLCVQYQTPLIYASSAATYGAGEFGYDDNHALVQKLKPLNPYGISKNNFDEYVLKQSALQHEPPFWAGLKFFNVYGPNEYHKGRMASVIFHAFHQLKNTGKVKLFRSHNQAYKDGEQLRDFIYVKDVSDIIIWLINTKPENGIYNIGTGKARTFYDLASATAHAMNMKPEITWINIPEDIREKYQYFTEASMQKIRNAGYTQEFISLEAGIQDYVQQYLMKHKYY